MNSEEAHAATPATNPSAQVFNYAYDIGLLA